MHISLIIDYDELELYELYAIMQLSVCKHISRKLRAYVFIKFWTRASVAATDHKIRQCIQRSALFPGRADGAIEGAKVLSKAREARRSAGAPRGGLGLERRSGAVAA